MFNKLEKCILMGFRNGQDMRFLENGIKIDYPLINCGVVNNILFFDS